MGRSEGLLGGSWEPLGMILSPLPLPPALERPPAATLCPPKINITLTSTSLNLTHLNSTHLISLLDPPRASFWSLLTPKTTQDRPKSPLDTLFFQKRLMFTKPFKTNCFRRFLPSKTAPKTTPNRPKTAPRRSSRASFFDIVFDIDFGASWVPFWPHLGPPWTPQRRVSVGGRGP